MVSLLESAFISAFKRLSSPKKKKKIIFLNSHHGLFGELKLLGNFLALKYFIMKIAPFLLPSILKQLHSLLISFHPPLEDQKLQRCRIFNQLRYSTLKESKYQQIRLLGWGRISVDTTYTHHGKFRKSISWSKSWLPLNLDIIQISTVTGIRNSVANFYTK